jgi:hypothetical protein
MDLNESYKEPLCRIRISQLELRKKTCGAKPEKVEAAESFPRTQSIGIQPSEPIAVNRIGTGLPHSLNRRDRFI